MIIFVCLQFFLLVQSKSKHNAPAFYVGNPSSYFSYPYLNKVCMKRYISEFNDDYGTFTANEIKEENMMLFITINNVI